MSLYKFSNLHFEAPSDGVFEREPKKEKLTTVFVNAQHLVSLEARALYVANNNNPSCYELKIGLVTGSILTFVTDVVSFKNFAKTGNA